MKKWRLKRIKKDKRTDIEKLVDEVTLDLRRTRLTIDYEYDENEKERAFLAAEYDIKLKTLERLHKLKEEKKRMSPDTIAIIAGNLIGIGMILNFEKLGVITSKALAFVVRGRV